MHQGLQITCNLALLLLIALFAGSPACADIGVPRMIPPSYPLAWVVDIVFLIFAIPLGILIRRAIKAKRLSPLAFGGVLLCLVGFLPTAFVILLSFVFPKGDSGFQPYVHTLKDLPKGKVVVTEDVEVQFNPPIFGDDDQKDPPLRDAPIGRSTLVDVPYGTILRESMVEPKNEDPRTTSAPAK